MAFPLRTVCALVCGLALASGAGAALPEMTQPGWAQLSEQQRQILAPLAADWDAMEAFRRKKWLGIAERYPAMSEDERVRVRQRMREWAALSPEERSLARDKYRSLQRVSPEMRESLRQNWEEYKSLPADEKKRLQDDAVRRPPASTIPPPAGLPKLRERGAP